MDYRKQLTAGYGSRIAEMDAYGSSHDRLATEAVSKRDLDRYDELLRGFHDFRTRPLTPAPTDLGSYNGRGRSVDAGFQREVLGRPVVGGHPDGGRCRGRQEQEDGETQSDGHEAARREAAGHEDLMGFEWGGDRAGRE